MGKEHQFDYEKGVKYEDTATKVAYSPITDVQKQTRMLDFKPAPVTQNHEVYEPLPALEIHGKVIPSGGREHKGIKRVLGLGRPLDKERIAAAGAGAGLGDVTDLILQAKNCPVWTLPVIEQVRWTILGPMTAANVQTTFGSSIDPFGSGKTPPGINFVETTMAQPGQLQTNTLILAIGFHVLPEILCFNAQGNAWTHPTASTAQPISPDVFVQNDRANGAFNPGIAAGTQVLLPAVYEHGWWANYALSHLVRGYNLIWRMGQHTNILYEELRNTAFMPQQAQDGSAGTSQVDIVDFSRRLNDFYDGLGSAFNFLPTNAIRTGTSLVGANQVGLFRPSRALEQVNVTYGGGGLRALLKNNHEFRVLSVPYLMQAGVPIGLVCEESDNTEGNIMRRYLDVTEGQGGPIPPSLTPDVNIPAALTDGTGVAGTQSAELSLDAAPARSTWRMDSQRVIFKGGELKLSMIIKGFEVDSDWMTTLVNDPTLRRILLNETGLGWAKK